MAKLTDIQIRAWIKAGERLKGAQTVIGFICATEQGSTLSNLAQRFCDPESALLRCCATAVCWAV